MAKILKVMIINSKIDNTIKHTYPPEYDAQKASVLAYTGLSDPDIAYCICVVTDADAPTFLVSPDITQLTQADAEILGEQWRPQVKKVLDQSKVMSILSKKALDEILTQDEKNALDPNNAEMGINMSKSFTDLLNETIVQVG